VNAVVASLSRNWWLYLMQGVLSVVLGVLILVWPGHALAVLIILFGLFALINGIILVFAAIGAAGVHQSWGWRLTAGIVGIVAGVAILRWPGVTALVLLYLVGIWAIATGIVELVSAFAEHETIPNAWLLALAGVVALLFGIAMFAWPRAGLLTIAYLVGIFAIVYGLFNCIIAFRARSLAGGRTTEMQAPPGALPSV
jgi:uncharacterized membrane protein HdeD (DUF308 family)